MIILQLDYGDRHEANSEKSPSNKPQVVQTFNPQLC